MDDNVTLALQVAERAVAAGARYLLFHENMVHEYPPQRGAQVLFCPFNNPGLRLYSPRILDQVRRCGLHFVGANRAGSYPMGLPGRGQSLIADARGQILAGCGGAG